MDGVILPSDFTKIRAPEIPADLALIWEQAGFATAAGDTTWFFDPRMQAGLRLVIANHTINGKTRKRDYGGWELAVHQAKCAHFAFNYPDDSHQHKRMRRAFAALLHDDLEDIRDRLAILGAKFGLNEIRAGLNVMTGIWGVPEDAPWLRRRALYMADRYFYWQCGGEKRLQNQQDRSFDPKTGLCLIDEDDQIIRFSDKNEQLDGDVRARKEGKLPDEKLEKQIEKAKRKSWVCAFPAIARFPQFADAYHSKIGFLESEFAATQKTELVAALGEPVAPLVGGGFPYMGIAAQAPAL